MYITYREVVLTDLRPEPNDRRLLGKGPYRRQIKYCIAVRLVFVLHHRHVCPVPSSPPRVAVRQPAPFMEKAINRAPLQRERHRKLCTALQADCETRCTAYTRFSYCKEHHSELGQTVAAYKHASVRAETLEPGVKKYAHLVRKRAFGTIEAVRNAIEDVEEYLRELDNEYEGRVVHSQRFYVNDLDEGHCIRMHVVQLKRYKTTDLLAQLLQYQCDLTAAEPQILEGVREPAKRSKSATGRAASYAVGLPAVYCGAMLIGLDDGDIEGYEGADENRGYVPSAEDEDEDAEPQDKEEAEGESDEENESVYDSEDSASEGDIDDDDDDDMMDDSLAGTFAGLLYWSLVRRGTYKQKEVVAVASKVLEEIMFLPPQHWAREAYRIVKFAFGRLEGPVGRYLINAHKSLSRLAFTPERNGSGQPRSSRNGFYVTWDNIYLQSSQQR
ncbi:hypothetical protein C8Q80DRAFT_348179 [Daedaleopsis nitida]|nr:hypothetical protein C8Q80DRAFT_348179 [Daedaleopsis nitida]